jgi:hypothetical protein
LSLKRALLERGDEGDNLIEVTFLSISCLSILDEYLTESVERDSSVSSRLAHFVTHILYWYFWRSSSFLFQENQREAKKLSLSLSVPMGGKEGRSKGSHCDSFHKTLSCIRGPPYITLVFRKD